MSERAVWDPCTSTLRDSFDLQMLMQISDLRECVSIRQKAGLTGVCMCACACVCVFVCKTKVYHL